MCRVFGWYIGDIVVGCDLASTLYKYDFRKSDLFVLSWARVRRMRRGISSELIMCKYYFVQYFVARCLETIDVCIWRCFIYISVSLGVLKYVVCLCKECDGCCV